MRSWVKGWFVGGYGGEGGISFFYGMEAMQKFLQGLVRSSLEPWHSTNKLGNSKEGIDKGNGKELGKVK